MANPVFSQDCYPPGDTNWDGSDPSGFCEGNLISCEDEGLITCPDGDCTGDISYCTENCDEGYVEDCHDENDCLLESWIGDGYPDCWPGTMWDLACYDNDGGDCDGYTTCEMQGLITCPNGECVESLEDCSDSTECVEGYVTDCSGDGDCCWDNWIGDGWADCSDQQYGCDLTCYDCDGGDCDCDDDCCSPGDYNCDTSIDVLDIVAIVNCVLENTDCPCGDLGGDGSVNVLDIVLLVNMILGGTDSSTVTDIDGNVYATVQIGDQFWMAENLKAIHYQNGDEIPYSYNDPQYGAYAEYNNDASNVVIYGRLYNWFAVNDERGLCPDNWHVPSDDEFKSLEMYLGMSESEANGEGLRGTDEGGQLKEEGNEHWNSPNTGATNETGFTALPGGNRRYETYTNQEIFCCLNRYGFFWSSSEVYTVNAWYRVLSYDYSESNRYHLSKTNAFSVRCVED